MTTSEYVRKWFPLTAYSYSLIVLDIDEDTRVVRDIEVWDKDKNRLTIQIPEGEDEDVYLDEAWIELVALGPK